jgi:type II secretory pathway component PulF
MLSAAMKDCPDIFSPFYMRLIRIGEIGGILDVVLDLLADYCKSLRIQQYTDIESISYWLIPSHRTDVAVSWEDLTRK